MAINPDEAVNQPDVRQHDDMTIFVSYSRKDARVVEPVVALLRLSGNEIFRDIDSIPPGARWRLRIASAIEACTTMIVFWCSHAYYSAEVKMEYQKAIELRKVVVPILLDAAEMPDDLLQRQAIDLRPALGVHADKVPEDYERLPDAALEQVTGGYLGLPIPGRLRVPSREQLACAATCLREKLQNQAPTEGDGL